VTLSSTEIILVSSVNNSFEYDYLQNGRLNVENSISSFEGCIVNELNFLTNVVDIDSNENNILFLTDGYKLTDISGDNFTYYSSNKNIEFVNSVEKTYDWLFLTSTHSNKLNILPLKNDFSENDQHLIYDNRFRRQYDGVYLKNNNIALQYKTNSQTVELLSDKETSIIVPPNITAFDINSSSLTSIELYGEGSPINSDYIILDRENIDHSSNNVNGIPLCIWYNDETEQWTERWYDPNTVDPLDAFIAQKNTTSSENSIIDIVSTEEIFPKNKLIYSRMGEIRNSIHINSFTDNSTILDITAWNGRFSSNGNEIYSVPALPNITSDIGLFDSNYHYHLPPQDSFFEKSDFTVSFWANQDWISGNDTQYFGNYREESGFGIFYENGSTIESITIATSGDMLYEFNSKGIKFLEKNLENSLGHSANITKIACDIDERTWMFDSLNKKFYIKDSDNLITNIISTSNSSSIKKMDIDSHGNLYAMFSDRELLKINNASFDTSVSAVSSYNDFYIKYDDSIELTYSDFSAENSEEDQYKILGTNLYKNNQIVYHLEERASSMRIDRDDNIWIIYRNKLLVLDKNSAPLIKKTFDLAKEEEITCQELEFITDLTGKTLVWLFFNSNNIIIILNLDGKLVKRIDVKNIINLKNCQTLMMSVSGFLSNYESLRRYFHTGNSRITVKGRLSCGEDNFEKFRLSSNANHLTGYNHIAFKHQVSNNYTIVSLYINGSLVASEQYNGIYFMDHGNKVTPFLIGARSGKLGAKNVEKSLNRGGYFKGSLSKLRYYKVPLDDYKIRSLAKEKHWNLWHTGYWNMPTPSTTNIELIKSLQSLSYPGHASNTYDLRIKNTNLSNDEKLRMENYIRSRASKYALAQSVLRNVIFE